MERQRLIKLIENRGTSSKEETNELWDIVRTFPYFQTARLLLAKSFHNQSSIHFHNELKTAAAYASDRKVLFHLINDESTKQKADEESNVFVIEQNQFQKETPVSKSSESYSENQFALSEESEEHIDTPVFEIKTDTLVRESKYKEEVQVQPEEIIKEKKSGPAHLPSALDEPTTTNEEIIRRRLSEILSKNKPEQQEEEKLAVDNSQTANSELPTSPEETITTKKEETVTHSVLDELPSEPMDVIEGLEIETIIEENYLQELEKLPEIIKPVSIERKEKATISEPSEGDSRQLSFIDWLKQKTAQESTLEEVTDEPDHFQQEIEKARDKPETRSSELINQFIATKPRMTPVKAEFYSPANMAKQSITDNEDIISETLARIYFEQGNYPKARSCYERLSLLYPEKSASFAPLIQKIDDILKENQM